MNTGLGNSLQTGKKILMKDKVQQSGMYILGVQGQGKSLLLGNLIYQDLQKGYAVILFDPHDDLINHVIAQMPEEMLNKTYILDMTDTDYPFGLNLFACSDPTDELERAAAVDRVMHVFEKLWPEMRGVLLEKLLRYITLTFLEHPERTLADIPHFLRDDVFRASIVNHLTNEDVKAYWQYEFNTMTPGERRRETQALANRLAAFLTAPFVKNIVGQRRTTIDFRQAIQEGEILLIRLPMLRMKDSATLIGIILLAHIHAATFAFGDRDWVKRPGFSLYVDEFQHFVTSDFADLFKEGRKFGVRTTVAHQDRSDLIPANRSATLTASTIVSFQLTPADAAEIAPLLCDATMNLRPAYIYPDVIRRLRFHENSEVQDFFRSYVVPLQKGKSDQEEDHQKILEVLQDLLYQAVTAGTINETLFEAYAESMFSLLDLIPDVPEVLQQKIQARLRILQDRIESLTALLTNDQTFCKYLVAYYSHYRTYARDHSFACSHHPQSLVPEEVLLTDTQFWTPLIRKFSNIGYLPIESILHALEKEAADYHALEHRDTPEKIITDEKEKILRRGDKLFQQIWKGIATLHQQHTELQHLHHAHDRHYCNQKASLK